MNGIDPVAVAGAAARRALDRRALGLRKENSHEPRGGPRPANPTYNKELLHFLSSSFYQQHTICSYHIQSVSLPVWATWETISLHVLT